MNELQKEELRLLKEFDRICRAHDISYMLSSGSLLGAIRHQGFIPWDDDIDVCMKRDEYKRLCLIIENALDDSCFFQTRETDKDYYHPFAKLRSNNLELKELSSAHLRAHQGVWLDIFPMDNIADNLTERSIQRKKVKIYNKYISAMYYTFVEPNDKGIKRIFKKVFSTINKGIHRVNFLVPYFYDQREKWLQIYNDLDCEYTNMLTFNYSDIVYETTLIANSSYYSLKDVVFEDAVVSIPNDYDEILTLLYGDYMKIPDEKDQVSNHYIVN